MGFRTRWIAAPVITAFVTASPYFSQAAVATSTSLTISAAGQTLSQGASIVSGSVVLLSAAVLAGSISVSSGQVDFCDASAASCTDIHLIAAAQLSSAGTATVAITPAPGTHSYKAVFQGAPNAATAFASSTSSTVALTVTGPYPSATSWQALTDQYNLTAVVGSVGPNPPTGAVNFIDTSDTNAVLANPSLGAPTTALTFLPPVAVGNYWADGYTLPQGASAAVDYAVGDFNRDGHLDFIVFSSSACQAGVCFRAGATVFLGDGTGHFFSGPFLNLGTAPPAFNISSFAIGDFNGDGILDLAIGSSTNQTVTIALGNGEGTFTAQSPISAGGAFESMVVGDFNGDGALDLAFLNTTANAVTLLVGKGDGTFTPSTAAISTVGGGTSMISADFNGDGLPDLAILGSSNNVTVLLADGNGSFTTATPSAITGEAYALASGDFNGDGIADLAVASYSSQNNLVTILLGKGDGTFTEASGSPIALTPSASLPDTAIRVGDFNADGKADLMVDGEGVLLGNGDGTFAVAFPSVQITPNAVGDFNSDGATDLVSGNVAINAIIVAVAATETAAASSSAITVPPASGSNLVLASYPGDTNHNPSQSGTVTLAAAQASPTVTLTAAPNPIVVNTPVTLTATVERSPAPAMTPTGTVAFYDGSALLGSATLNGSGVASFTAGTLAVGSHSVTAAYAGDSNYLPSTSQAVVVMVAMPGSAAPNITLTTSSGSITTAQALTATVTVSGANGSSMPTGFVNLSSGAWTAQQPLGSGSTNFIIPAGALGTGSDTLTAAYSGDATYAAATATASVTVSQLIIAVTSPASVAPGASATATATVTAGSGYSGTLNLTCSLASSPTGAQILPACNLNPSSLTLNAGGTGTTTLTVTTTAGSSSAFFRPFKLLGFGGGGMVLAGILLLGMPSRRHLRWFAILAFACLCTGAGLIGCNGGAQQHSVQAAPGTTAGIYTFTISATGTVGAATNSSTTVSVTVQ